MRREWVKETMEAVRRGFCDSTERGKDRWVRVGLRNTGTSRGAWQLQSWETQSELPDISQLLINFV